MPPKKKSKTVIVKEHPRRVPVSKKNPKGRTIVDRHLRHIEGSYLNAKMIDHLTKKYNKKK